MYNNFQFVVFLVHCLLWFICRPSVEKETVIVAAYLWLMIRIIRRAMPFPSLEMTKQTKLKQTHT